MELLLRVCSTSKIINVLVNSSKLKHFGKNKQKSPLFCRVIIFMLAQSVSLAGSFYISFKEI